VAEGLSFKLVAVSYWVGVEEFLIADDNLAHDGGVSVALDLPHVDVQVDHLFILIIGIEMAGYLPHCFLSQQHPLVSIRLVLSIFCWIIIAKLLFCVFQFVE
jgi:hypothetical protein